MDEEVEIILQREGVEVSEPLVADYVLPTATTNTLGGVKIGNNINIDTNGHISVPVASSSTSGVVKVGDGLEIDDNGVLRSTGGYELPQATKTTLGGVYVDDELNTESGNPVQNAVVSLGLNSISGNLSTLSGTVSGMSGTVAGLVSDVGSLSSTVTTLGNNVTALGNTVDNVSGTVSTLSNTVGTLNNDVTNLQVGLGETSEHVGELIVETNLVIPYSELLTGTWTSGDITVIRRGLTGYIICNLEGTLTIPANDNITLFTTDTPMTTGTIGVMTDGSNVIETMTDISGAFIVVNNSSSSLTINRIVGTIPLIFAEENES